MKSPLPLKGLTFPCPLALEEYHESLVYPAHGSGCARRDRQAPLVVGEVSAMDRSSPVMDAAARRRHRLAYNKTPITSWSSPARSLSTRSSPTRSSPHVRMTVARTILLSYPLQGTGDSPALAHPKSKVSHHPRQYLTRLLGAATALGLGLP